jgi:hypothetical protein
LFKMAKVVGFEPTIMVLETTALDQAKLHRHGVNEGDRTLDMRHHKPPLYH